jgi:DNA-binding Lrp family transcriptional regulator
MSFDFLRNAIDRNILRALRLNARVSNVDLAEEVGLSPSACLRRIKLLEKTGVIRGYTALVETGAGSQGLAVLINITPERQTVEYLNKFEAAVRKHPEIQECYLMTGGRIISCEWKQLVLSNLSTSTKKSFRRFQDSHVSIPAFD